MARLLSPQGWFAAATVGGHFVTSAGATATVYADAVSGTLADIAAYNGTNTPGAVIPGSTLVVDATSSLPLFWLPDGVSVVWVQVGSGPRFPVAADPAPRLDAITASWVDWSSSFQIAASTTNPTKGNSTYTARYKQIGKTVHYAFTVIIGSTFGAGSGAYLFPLPFSAVTSVMAVGAAYILDSGTAHRTGSVAIVNATQCSIFRPDQGSELGSAGPGTAWANGDTIKASITYEAA